MSQFVFANNVNTTLAGGISSTATTMTLASAQNVPTIPAGTFWAVTLNDQATQGVFEVVYVTATSGANLTILRGQEGTTAQAWLAGDFVFAGVTAGILEAAATTGSVAGSGYAKLGNGLYLQWGTSSAVPADGSGAVPVTFPVAFPSACFIVVPAIENAYQTNPWQLSAQYDSPTRTGFNLNVTGAPVASPTLTTSVSWYAIGN